MSNKSHRKTSPAWTKQGVKSPSEKAARDRRLWMLFGIAVAVVLVAVVVIAAVAGGGDDKTVSNGAEIRETNEVDVVSGDALPLFESPESDTAIGKVAPQVSGSSIDGGFISTRPENGNYKMIVFVAHWCPHCQREIPRLVDWAAKGELPDNLEVMAVSTAVDETRGNYPPSEWLASEEWPFPVMADNDAGTAADSFGLSAFPYFVVLSPEGEVVARNSGEIELETLQAMLSSAMGS